MSLEAQKGEEVPCGSCSNFTGRDGTTVMELLDEYWFFHNKLDKGKILRRLPLPLASSQSKVKESSLVKRTMEEEGLAVSHPESSKDDRSTARTLLRTPSLPPRVRQPETSHEETSPSNLSSSKLRHSSNSWRSHQPRTSSSPCSSSKGTRLETSITRHRSPRATKSEGINRYGTNQHYIAGEFRWRKVFLEKKWKSLSDLENEEVQGFKDLGFVFDNEGLNPSLLRVIPGLSGVQTIEDDGEVQRPYLSEAWLVQRSAPPMISWVDKRSAEDMKEQLRFWARAVACNVRQH